MEGKKDSKKYSQPDSASLASINVLKKGVLMCGLYISVSMKILCDTNPIDQIIDTKLSLGES